jgi:methyl-accepting chemotaxis protein
MQTPRRKKLVQPGFQLHLISRFAGLAALAMLLQFGLLTFQVMRGTASLGPDGGELAIHLPGMLLTVLGLSALIVLPIIFFVGLSLTHRIVGPIDRMQAYLTEVSEGRESKPLVLRDGDEMKQLVASINSATAAQREKNGASGASEGHSSTSAVDVAKAA